MTDKELLKRVSNIINQVEKLMNDPDIKHWQKNNIGVNLAFEIITQGAENGYEGVGMIEKVKKDYMEVIEEIEVEEQEGELKIKRNEIRL